MYRKQGAEAPSLPKQFSSANIDDNALGEAGSTQLIRPIELKARTEREPPAFPGHIIEFLERAPDLSFRVLTDYGGQDRVGG